MNDFGSEDAKGVCAALQRADPFGWFRDARFGLFLHWGLYSLPAGEWEGKRMEYIGEWLMSRYRIPIHEYEALATRFDPSRFDADAWARLARRAGMRYVVFTAKHHDGFAMYHSRRDRYNIVDAAPFGRDPLRELADACAAHGLGLGIYYSQSLDWHEEGGGAPPPGTPDNHGMSWDNDWDFPAGVSDEQFASYFERKARPQIEELLTGYGPLSVFWFDTPFTITADQCRILWRLVRKHQPRCLVNTRLGHGAGDIHSFGDNQLPSSAPAERAGVAETAATLNDTWGYKHFDHNWKTPEETLRTLLALASRDVNYLLNIGPTGEGEFPAPAVRVLETLGDWMAVNGAAIHGTRASPFPYELDACRITRRHDRLFLCDAHWPDGGGALTLNGLLAPPRRAHLLARPEQELPLDVRPLGGGDGFSVAIPPPEGPPPGLCPVVVLEFGAGNDPAAVSQRLLPQGDGSLILPAYRAGIDVAPRGDVDGDTGRTGTSADRVGAAGERFAAMATPRIDDTGTVTGWHDPRDGLRWRFRVLDAGEYAVELVTSAVHHQGDWHGGHRIRFDTGDGATLRAEVRADAMLTTGTARYYPQALTHCGRLRLPAAETTLVLRAEHIDPTGGVGLAVVRVRLVPCPA